jgi:hypothetical protein
MRPCRLLMSARLHRNRSACKGSAAPTRAHAAAEGPQQHTPKTRAAGFAQTPARETRLRDHDEHGQKLRAGTRGKTTRAGHGEEPPQHRTPVQGGVVAWRAGGWSGVEILVGAGRRGGGNNQEGRVGTDLGEVGNAALVLLAVLDFGFRGNGVAQRLPSARTHTPSTRSRGTQAPARTQRPCDVGSERS